MKSLKLTQALLLVVLPLVGCDGQQYVNPGTALLSVTHDSTGSKLLTRCNYVPVLLGAQVSKQYRVDEALQAFITLTRDDITVAFQGVGAGFEPFRVATEQLDVGAVEDDDPPTGYTVELSSGCTPD